jgi:cytoskeletal protein CcmA (bactofilin family)
MSYSVPLARIDARPLLTASIVVFGLVALLPLPAHADEQRLVGDIVVRGVEQDVSTVAGNVTVHGRVEDDVHSAKGDITVSGDGNVQGDIDAGLGNVDIQGPVGGDVHAAVGDVYVNAPVEGDVEVGHGDVQLGPKAEISDDLKYGDGEFTGDSKAVKGDIMANGMTLDLDESQGPEVLGFVGWLVAALAFAACAVLAAVIVPRPLAAAARRAEETPGRAFVYGLLSLPAFFVLCVVLAVSIIGIPFLLLLAPAYLALLVAGALVAAFFLGTKVLMFTGRYRVGNAMAAVVGALILAAITFIPILGDLILYAICLLGAGAVILALFSRRPRATHPSYEDYVRDRTGD